MKKYIVTVTWRHGFVHTYDVIGGMPGSHSDAVHCAKEHLNSARNIIGYTIQDQDGNIVYEKPADNPKT
jgi:hypothetical protein